MNQLTIKEVLIMDYRSTSSESNNSINFPLPEHLDPKLCRDKFLQQILAPSKRSTFQSNASSVPSTFAALEKNLISGEGLAILKLLQQDEDKQLPNQFVDIVEPESEESLTLNEKQQLFTQYSYKMQNASIQYTLMHMLSAIQLCGNMWPGNITSIPHRLFAWSVDNFLRRVSLNQLYLDVLKRNMPRDILDCYKFKIDCNECCRLIEFILDDVRNEEDLCSGAMEEIRTAYYDQNSECLPQCGNLRGQCEQLVKELSVLNLQLKTIDENIRGRRLLNLSNVLEANDPIENRYRLRWTRNHMEESIHYADIKKRAIQNELNQLKDDTIVDDYTFESTNNMYNTLLETYRLLIVEWQERYDKDLEEAEMQCSIMLNSIQKVSDDVKYYTDQMEYFKKRIAEVRQEIKLEEELALKKDRKRISLEMKKQDKNINKKK